MKPEIRLFDYHVHTLEHGLGRSLQVKETVEAAINRNLSAICLTDHYPLPPGFIDPTKEKDCAMPLSLYSAYQEKVSKVKKQHKDQIEVLEGAEFDWLPEYKDWIREQIALWPFDYVIGSVHFLDQSILDYKEEKFLQIISFYGGIRPLVERYYKTVREMVRSGLFDDVGHLDLVKKYNDGSLFLEDATWYRNAVLQTLNEIAKIGMVLELNTAGWSKKCKASYPSLWILQEARRRNILLTIGSDSHTPGTLGRNLDKAINLAKIAGYRSLALFKKRQIEEVTI